jgi:hypothetical protein
MGRPFIFVSFEKFAQGPPRKIARQTIRVFSAIACLIRVRHSFSLIKRLPSRRFLNSPNL